MWVNGLKMYHHFAPFVTLKKTLNIYHMIVRVSNLFGKNWFLSKVYCYLENYCTWILRWSQGKTLVLNNLKACVAYTIYKYKMKCRFHDETMSKKKILYVLKGKLNVQNTVLRKIDYIRKIFIKIFVIICKVCEKLSCWYFLLMCKNMTLILIKDYKKDWSLKACKSLFTKS